MSAVQDSTSIANTLGLACEAEVVKVTSAGEVLEAIRFAEHAGKQLLPLGQGSNVVLPPELAARVLYVTDQSLLVLSQSDGQVTVRVGAGMDWHKLVLKTVAEGFFGLENLALIPGLVGAAPVQNIGAYGRELASFVKTVHAVDMQRHEVLALSAQECAFAYRDSIFKGELRDRMVITAVDFTLSQQADVECSYPALAACFVDRQGPPTPAEVCQAVIALRRRRLPDPAREPNAGSFFKNPVIDAAQAAQLKGSHPDLPTYAQGDGRVKVPAAWLIEQAGLRGAQAGAAAVSAQHSLVLVNRGGAAQSDILALAKQVQATVMDAFAVALEPEPRIY